MFVRTCTYTYIYTYIYICFRFDRFDYAFDSIDVRFLQHAGQPWGHTVDEHSMPWTIDDDAQHYAPMPSDNLEEQVAIAVYCCDTHALMRRDIERRARLDNARQAALLAQRQAEAESARQAAEATRLRAERVAETFR